MRLATDFQSEELLKLRIADVPHHGGCRGLCGILLLFLEVWGNHSAVEILK